MKRISLIIMMALTVSLTSCIKDNAVNLAPGASPPVLEWATAAIEDAPYNAAGNIYRIYTRTLTKGGDVTMRLQVSYTGTDAAPQDIAVGIGTHPTAFTEYKTKYGYSPATTTQMDASAYVLPTNVKVAKGAHYGDVNVVVHTASLTSGSVYMIPLTITSASGVTISSNYGTVMYRITVN